ncbi:MAG TPA: hypothetical protein VN914_11685 [Polyangia bacterium]|nr:hypothetical protein [Polyangia bacterium]
MVGSRGNGTTGRRAVWVGLLLAACSSSGGSGGAGDAASGDAPAADMGGEDAADAAPDARGGSGGTVRGGTGGTSRGTGGATGGSTGGSGPPVDAAIEPDAASPTSPANDTCQAARPIVLDKPHLDLAASTRGAGHHRDLPCVTGGGDVFFSFTLAERELVYADTFGAGFNTVLAFSDGCGDVDAGAASGSEPSCLDDACGTKQSQVVALLAPGKHYLVLSGAAGESGDATVHLEHAPVGAGPVSALGVGASVTSGTTSGTGQLSLCEAGGPENSYWWTSCQGFAGGPFMASTCSNTIYDTLLALQIPRTATLVCNDDACKLQAAITTSLPPGAGLHVLSVDGFTPRHQGAYTLSTTRP